MNTIADRAQAVHADGRVEIWLRNGDFDVMSVDHAREFLLELVDAIGKASAECDR